MWEIALTGLSLGNSSQQRRMRTHNWKAWIPCLSPENTMINNANFENLRHLKGIEISNSKLKTYISKTQTILIWDENPTFLRLKPCISEAQTGYFWGSNQVFLRLKPGMSETQTRYVWDSNHIFLRLKPCISELKPGISEAQTMYFWVSNQVFLGLKPCIMRLKSCISELKPCISEPKPCISEPKPCISELKPHILKLKPCISETQTMYFWDSNHVFLRLKPSTAETNPWYFWGWNWIFLGLGLGISVTEIGFCFRLFNLSLRISSLSLRICSLSPRIYGLNVESTRLSPTFLQSSAVMGPSQNSNAWVSEVQSTSLSSDLINRGGWWDYNMTLGRQSVASKKRKEVMKHRPMG